MQMTDVFISYSHIDSAVAGEFCQMLDTEGITYFRDVKKLDWGDSINLEVGSALEGSLAMIVIISPASLKSYWVPYEIGYAIALRKRILPYLTHPSLDIPPFISDLKYTTTIEQAQGYFHTNFIDEKNNAIPPSMFSEGADQLSKLQKAYRLMPDLLQEMKSGILSDKTRLIREFVVLHSEGVIFNSQKLRFVYFESQHENLLNKINLLEEYGFIFDITPGDTPIYRMIDEFIDLITSTNFDTTA